MTDHRTINAIFESQHGVASRAQLLEAGVTRRMVEHRLATAQWRRLAPGVYRSTAAPATWQGALMIATLSTGGVASHRSAARLWGIDGLRWGPPEVTVNRRTPLRRVGVRVHESVRWDLCDPVRREAIPTTGVERTVVDLARVLGPVRLTVVIDDVLRRRLTTIDDLYEVARRHRCRGRKGVPRLQNILEERDPRQAIPQGLFNRQVGELLVRAGLPEPEYEHEVFAAGRLVARVDLAYPVWRVAIENQSRRWHDNSRSFDADPACRNELVRLGWRVLEFTWTHVKDHPSWVVDTVSAVLPPPS